MANFNMKNLILIAIVSIITMSCSQQQKEMKPYVIEVTTFQYNTNINTDRFWARDAQIEEDYTKLQPGYISRESGYSENSNEVVVVVRWKTQADADASMKKFMEDKSVADYAAMINGATMKMARYNVE